MKYGVYTSKSAGCFIEKQMYEIYRYTLAKKYMFLLALAPGITIDFYIT